MEELATSILSKSRKRVQGRDLTTFAIGGEIELLVEPNSVEELQSVLNYLQKGNRPYKVIGAGSNLLIPDEGLTGIVIRLGQGFRSVSFDTSSKDEVFIRAGGAMALMTLSRSCSEKGLSGLEFAGGIPASCGGAAWMNAGAHGNEMADVITKVELVTCDGELRKFSRQEIQFSYRHSGLPPGSIVSNIELRLVPADPNEVAARRAEYLAERKKRQPLSAPSAGSVFRNPSRDMTAGAVLEKSGCKGLKIGGAEVSALHANWIINPERKAKAEDVKELVEVCQTRAFDSAGVKLSPEVVAW